ncbi:phosphoribosyl 1,2-cyclic phosphodiesterase [Pontibacter aydingkolensis]|uniref:MBL fold metallo-hydrolase n=1 Tax=Pontibacter aydingkolensis TaxID=1911536 RepID=A0ABS7CXA6_9BACT|nr:MBL fold metallo-hydrolase [Pontibacter aydingkolensis]MBW7468445.1 MBL fold metallo-hydrolase [Pontibacter aydingkolensis]
MHLHITSLNSGSNGNCYYIGNEHEAVLVDAGISCRETERRMARLGLSMSKVKAIFVSHEHSDHIKGIPVLAKKYKLPVYITPHTLRRARFEEVAFPVHTFNAQEPVKIGNLEIIGFPKLHDAIDPYSFIISYQGTKVGVFTDIGAPCEQLIHYFSQCHAAILEANYDEVMLAEGYYPYHLKRRISGGKGHLSNRQALNLFTAYKPAYMSHLLLGHLSKNNNCPKLVDDLFNEHAAGTNIMVASRYEETPVFRISSSDDVGVDPAVPFIAKPVVRARSKPMKGKAVPDNQLQLF